MKRSSSPKSLTRCLLLLILFGACYRGFFAYGVQFPRNVDMGPFQDFLRGTAPAPLQYRIGVLGTAGWLYEHWHVPLRYSFSLLDLISGGIALLLGYTTLRHRPLYRSVPPPGQWLASAAYLALVLFFLCWQDFYKKPETLPAAALASLLLWLWSPVEEERRTGLRRSSTTIISLLLLTLALSLVRADLACSLALGVLAAAAMPRPGPLSLPRGPAIPTAALCAMLAGGTQLLLMRVIFPHAGPYAGGHHLLRGELHHPWEFVIFLAYILPVLWTALELRRHRYTQDGAGLGFLLAALPFTLLWVALGRIEEVRIFLPIALALVPLMAQTVLLRACPPAAAEERPRHRRERVQ